MKKSNLNKVFDKSRRRFLRTLFTIAIAPPVLSYLSWFYPKKAYALTDTATELSLHEKSILEILTQAIIPTDHEAGALELYVPQKIEYIVLSRGAESVTLFKEGLNAVDFVSQSIYGQNSYTLSELQLQYLIEVIVAHPQLSLFWDNLRSLTVLTFYTDPIGYTQIGLPGPNIDLETFKGADKNAILVC